VDLEGEGQGKHDALRDAAQEMTNLARPSQQIVSVVLKHQKVTGMKNKQISLMLTLLLASLVPHAFSSSDRGTQASTMQTPQMPAADAAPAGKLTKIDARMVCMVRNHAFDEPQIPIEIKGKTYYGCCEMCKGMLAKDRKQRVAIDPISKKQVDKATAVIGVGSNKGILYFENEANLEKYNASLGQ
jgi:YHS domain-containing protein